VREGLADEALGPRGRRLVGVEGPRAGLIEAIPYRFDEVTHGQVLAVVRTGNRNRRVLAPCDGTVVSPRPQAGRPVPSVLFWIRRQRS
jgi:hypothetical protein